MTKENSDYSYDDPAAHGVDWDELMRNRIDIEKIDPSEIMDILQLILVELKDIKKEILNMK